MKIHIYGVGPVVLWLGLVGIMQQLPADEVPQERATFEIRGRCEDLQAEDLPGVRVRLFVLTRSSGTPEQIAETRSDAEGRFHFADLQPPVYNQQAGEFRTYAVVATKEGLTSVLSRFFSVSPERVLTLRKSEPVKGRVVDERGNPVQDATVFTDGLDGQPLDGILSAATDVNGQFVLSDYLPVRSSQLRVHHADFGTQRISVAEFKNGGELSLKDPAVVHGVAIDAVTRQPAADVHVYAQFTIHAEHYGEAQTRTDKNGRFRLLLVPDVYNIWASMPGRTMVAHDSFEAAVGANPAADFQMITGGFIKGRLLSADGEPVGSTAEESIFIGLHGPSRPWSGPAVESVPVQSDGTYEFRVPPGDNAPYVMSAGVIADRNPRNVSKLPPITVQDGEAVTVDIHLTGPQK